MLRGFQDSSRAHGLDETIEAAAAAERRLDVPHFLRNQQPEVPWGVAVWTAAASQGHLDVLVWLKSQAACPPWDTATLNAAAFNGHAAVFEWLWHCMPKSLQDATKVDVHVNFVQSVWKLLPASGKGDFLAWAGCSAACHRNAQCLRWVLSVDPASCKDIVLQTQLRLEPDAIGFMHSMGCLNASEVPHEQLEFAVAFPAAMGGLVGLKKLKEVMIAHAMLPSALIMTCIG